ncbi:hypothetical protein [Nocardiopsis rhodophaea]|uniref:hypothetical protein n=1 Tax=Nocardiopsis rhodophaea TaxID=280238 RepID=UPI0031DCE817
MRGSRLLDGVFDDVVRRALLEIVGNEGDAWIIEKRPRKLAPGQEKKWVMLVH